MTYVAAAFSVVDTQWFVLSGGSDSEPWTASQIAV
jgi:hypothetical protein